MVPEAVFVGSSVLPVPWFTVSLVAPEIVLFEPVFPSGDTVVTPVFHPNKVVLLTPVEAVASVLELPGATDVLRVTPVVPL